MEAQRVRQSKAFLFCPQIVLVVNIDEDRCSAPSVSIEASSLGEVGEAWPSLKLSWDSGAQELPLEQQCFERKRSLLGQELCSGLSEVAESITMMLSDPAAICKVSLKYHILLGSRLSFLSQAYLPPVIFVREERHCWRTFFFHSPSDFPCFWLVSKFFLREAFQDVSAEGTSTCTETLRSFPPLFIFAKYWNEWCVIFSQLQWKSLLDLNLPFFWFHYLHVSLYVLRYLLICIAKECCQAKLQPQW